jgi:hypothetical protein
MHTARLGLQVFIKGGDSSMDTVLAGRYELQEPLGRGSAGEVWRGNDLVSRKPVAIKLVDIAQVDDLTCLSESVRLFRAEAEVITGLRNPNVVGALDAGRMGNQLFMATDLVPGISLAQMMDERGARGMGLFPVSSVLRIAEQVCSGLAAVHEVGIVHHSIQPSNLIVTPSLGVRIIDFGVARLLADNAARLMVPSRSAATIAYMSPEEAAGGEVDGRADLYSLGCVMYQLLAGRPPFFSALPSALLMMQVIDQATPLAEVRPDLPPEACELVGKLIEKDAGARPASAQEAIAQIRELRRMFGDEVTEFEADRSTVLTESPALTESPVLTESPARIDALTRFDNLAVGATALEPEVAVAPPVTAAVPPAVTTMQPAVTTMQPAVTTMQPALPAAVLPAPAARPMLTPARMAELSDELPVSPAASRTGTGWMAAKTPPGSPRVPVGRVSVPAQPGMPRTSGPVRAPSQQLPAARPPRRRSIWPGVLVTLLVALLAGGGGAFYWLRVSNVMKVESLSISTGTNGTGTGPHSLLTDCNGRIDLVGTIDTNGRTGTIEYEWVLDGKSQPVKYYTASGSPVEVTMQWTLRGQGQSAGTDTATLDILSPRVSSSTENIPYNCSIK